MNTILQIIVPSLLLPLLLSVILWNLSERYPALTTGLPFIWLPSCFWIAGWPNLMPLEAIDWLWILVISTTGIHLWLKKQTQLEAIAQSLIFAPAIVLLSWPVLQHQPDIAFVAELLMLLIAGVIWFYSATIRRSSTPTLALAISSGGLGLVTALGGSVLVGQLAGALASVLLAFAGHELLQKISIQEDIKTDLIKQRPSSITTSTVLQIYLALLLIARIYAEIPLPSAMLLLIAPFMILLTNKRLEFIGSIVTVAAALFWLLTTADASSYY